MKSRLCEVRPQIINSLGGSGRFHPLQSIVSDLSYGMVSSAADVVPVDAYSSRFSCSSTLVVGYQWPLYRPTSSSSLMDLLPLKKRRADMTLTLAGTVASSVSWSLLILVVALSDVCFLISPFCF